MSNLHIYTLVKNNQCNKGKVQINVARAKTTYVAISNQSFPFSFILIFHFYSFFPSLSSLLYTSLLFSYILYLSYHFILLIFLLSLNKYNFMMNIIIYRIFLGQIIYNITKSKKTLIKKNRISVNLV